MADVELRITAETKEALDSIQNFASGSISALKGFAAAAVAYLGGRAVVGALESFIDAASESEDAVNTLNVSLASAGTYSQEASDAFQKFAQEMQNTTGVSDELILNQVAIARNFTKTNEEAKKLTQAAIQLSAATGKDLNTSIEMLGKSVEGIGGGLNKTLPATKGFTEAQLKAGAAVDYVLSRFSGVAEAKMLTFSGAITGAKNAFGDLYEIIGDVIIKNPILIDLINTARKIFIKFGETLSANREYMADLVSKGFKLLVSAIPKVLTVIDYLVKAFGAVIIILGKSISITAQFIELMLEFKLIKTIINVVKDGFVTLGAGIVGVFTGIFDLLSSIPGVSTAFEKLGINVESVTNKMNSFKADLLDNVGKDITTDLADGLKNVREIADSATAATVDGLVDVSGAINTAKEFTIEYSAKIETMGSTQEDASKKAIEALNKQKEALEKAKKEAEKYTKEIEETFKNPFNFVVNVILEKFDIFKSDLNIALNKAKDWLKDHELEVKLTAAGAGLLNSIFKSGAMSPKKLEDELVAAIDGAKAQLNAAIGEINRQRDEAILQIEGDFSGAVSDIQKELENGSITQLEYQEKINVLEKKRSDDIKKENKKAQEQIQAERVKNEQEIAKIREDHQKKLNDLQEKNVQAAAQIAGQMANAVGSAFGLPPIFGDIMNMLAAPPEVWQGIIDGLVSGLPVFIQRLAENLPTIITALAEAMPQVAVALVDALLKLLTDPNFYAKLLEANIKMHMASTNALLEIIKKVFGEGGRKILDAGSEFVKSVVSGAGEFIKKLLDAIGGGAKNVTGGIKNIMTGNGQISDTAAVILGPAAPLASQVSEWTGIKFAKGGMVPDGFPNDTFSAKLTSGEMVIPTNDVDRLSAFLDKQESAQNNSDIVSQLRQALGSLSGEKQININLQVGEKELASVILDLNRRGFRTV